MKIDKIAQFDFNHNFIFFRGTTRFTKRKGPNNVDNFFRYYKNNCNSFRLEFIYE